jgi:hypothetical protein
LELKFPSVRGKKIFADFEGGGGEYPYLPLNIHEGYSEKKDGPSVAQDGASGESTGIIDILYRLMETIHGYFCLTSPRSPARSPLSHKERGIQIIHYPLPFA